MNYLLSITVLFGITSIVLCLDSKELKEPYGPQWGPPGGGPDWGPQGGPEWGPEGEPNWGYPSHKPSPSPEPLDAICILQGKKGTVKFTQEVIE